MTWKCRLGWHTWSDWSEPRQGTLTRGWSAVEVEVVEQHRTCTDCKQYEQAIYDVAGRRIG